MQNLWALRNHSVIRYLMVGGSAFIIQYSILNLGYYALSIPLHISVTIGYIAGLIISFVFNRMWVFGERGKNKHIAHQGAQYILLVIVNYIFTIFGVLILKKEGVEPYISPFITTGLIVIWNYILFNKVIFKSTY